MVHCVLFTACMQSLCNDNAPSIEPGMRVLGILMQKQTDTTYTALILQGLWAWSLCELIGKECEYSSVRKVDIIAVTELLQRHRRVLLQFSKLVQELLEALRRAPRVLPLSERQATASQSTACRQSRLFISASLPRCVLFNIVLHVLLMNYLLS